VHMGHTLHACLSHLATLGRGKSGNAVWGPAAQDTWAHRAFECSTGKKLPCFGSWGSCDGSLCAPRRVHASYARLYDQTWPGWRVVLDGARGEVGGVLHERARTVCIIRQYVRVWSRVTAHCVRLVVYMRFMPGCMTKLGRVGKLSSWIRWRSSPF